MLILLFDHFLFFFFGYYLFLLFRPPIPFQYTLMKLDQTKSVQSGIVLLTLPERPRLPIRELLSFAERSTVKDGVNDPG